MNKKAPTNNTQDTKHKAYPKYKPSGVEWLGDVPAHWEIWKISHGFGVIGSGTTPKSDDYENYDGDIPWVTTSELRETIIYQTKKTLSTKALEDNPVLRLYPKGTLLFAMYGATIGRMGILGIDATVNQACCAFTSPIKFDTKFVFYWLLMRQPILLSLSSGGGQPNLSQDDLRNIRIPVPSLEEQRRIAIFLDRETGRIDSLITQKQRLLELLAEQRSALISRAVTKGLNPDVKMKPSGIEWLGDVPEHWSVSSIKRIVAIPVTDGPHETPEILDEGIPFVSAEAIRNNKIDFEKKRGYISESEHRRFCLKYHPKRDDIYMIKSGATTGNLAIVETDEEFSIWSPLAAIRVNPEKANARFILQAMSSKEFQTSVQLFWSFGTQQNIGMNVIENLYIPIPPLPEQQKIAAFLDNETAKIDALSDKATNVIKMLNEYRMALISSAVTGKIDVRQ